MPNWVRPELPRRCGGLTGFLRKSRVSHPLVSVTHRTHTGADTGGGVPEWVPADAKIYIDLIAPGRAWTETDGEVAIDTLLGADANTVNGWGATAYNAGNLTADGYTVVQISIDAAFIGSARDKILSDSGATVVGRVLKIEGLDSTNIWFELLSTNGSDAVEVGLRSNLDLQIDSWNGSASAVQHNVTNTGGGALNCLAVTVTATRLEAAANGGSPVAVTLLDADRPAANPFVATVFNGFSQSIQSITIYDALPSTAGLSALSETGVTNTAPHDLVWEWGVHAPDGVVTANDINFSGNGWDIVKNITVTDDEGNPLSFTLGGADGDKFALGAGPISVYGINSYTFTPGIYTFTIRATDPGGLYVEQEFTITVTA